MLRKSDWFFIIAVVMSFAISVYLWFTDDKQAGLWVPSLLSLAVYVKLLTGGRRDG